MVSLKLAALLLVGCAIAHVHAAHSAWCTIRLDGKGDIAQQVTKDCCAATREHSSTQYNEASHECQDAGGFGNGINLGRFVSCCGGRGAGSHSPS